MATNRRQTVLVVDDDADKDVLMAAINDAQLACVLTKPIKTETRQATTDRASAGRSLATTSRQAIGNLVKANAKLAEALHKCRQTDPQTGLGEFTR